MSMTSDQLRKALSYSLLPSSAFFTVKKGDNVLFTSYAGTEIKIDDQDFLIMSEDDILGIIE